MTSIGPSELGHVLIVGGGSMGQAICAGIMRLGTFAPADVTVANPGIEKREKIEREHGVNTVASATEALPADTIILAVKPNVVAGVAKELADAGIGEARVVSIAAGVSTGSLEAIFGENTQVVRVMPNTPLIVGQGMSAISGGAQATPETLEKVRALFASMGGAVIVPEDQQDAVTAVSGSGPAYFELFCQQMAKTGADLGLDADVARQLALQTMYGTAKLVIETDQDLDAAIEAVSSPGGTTIAALDAMREGKLPEAIDAGVRAAAKRSAELGE
jgi:pyrroline-5-carboxylate reductase